MQVLIASSDDMFAKWILNANQKNRRNCENLHVTYPIEFDWIHQKEIKRTLLYSIPYSI